MIQRDPQGYYACLGVKPSATQAEIKAAYRVRAMELHPDRNPGRDTTQRFQQLQRAYDVLFDSDSRTAYDALAVDPVASQAESSEPTRFEPIYCSRCGCVSAMPRYRVFYSVFGYVFGAVKRPHQGVFCAKCETIVALLSFP
jgi:DnaJ-class molecular chaperone